MARANDEHEEEDKQQHANDHKQQPAAAPGLMIERDVPADQMTTLQRALAEPPQEENE